MPFRLILQVNLDWVSYAFRRRSKTVNHTLRPEFTGKLLSDKRYAIYDLEHPLL